MDYRDGPVGPYRELFAAALILRGGRTVAHVGFMAVDSEESLAGGRENWALPKVPARFDPMAERRGGARITGDGWSVAVAGTARSRAAPAALAFTGAQVGPDGVVREFTVRLHGRVRLGRAEVRHDLPAPLAAWLRAGRHAAVVFSGRQTVI